MQVEVKPSDLYFRYPRVKATRELPKFAGKPDPRPFDRDDLYEVLPLLGAVLGELECADARLLHYLEEVMLQQMPACVATREEVFDCLVAVGRDWLEG